MKVFVKMSWGKVLASREKDNNCRVEFNVAISPSPFWSLGAW